MDRYLARAKSLLHGLKHPYDEKEGNRYKILIESCFNNVTANLVGGNFFTGLMIYLNANTVELGLVNVIIYLCNTLQVLSPLLLNKFEQRKKLLIGARIVIYFMNIVLIGIISTLPISNRIQIYLILGCVALLNIVSAFTAQGFSLWHMESVPKHRRAVHFSQNTTFANIAIYAFVLGGSALLDRFKAADMELLGLIVLRIIALVIATGDIYWLSKIKEYPYSDVKQVRLKDIFIIPFRHKRYLVSIAIVFLWNFVATTCGSYFSVYLLDNLKMSYSFINLCSSMYVPMVIFLAPVWARYVNKTSWLSVLYKVLIAYGIAHISHIFVMEGIEWIYFFVVFSCFIFSPAINIIMPNMSFYNLPREHQSICLSFCTALANIGAMFGTYYAILFMSAFKGFSFVMFGKTFITAQLMPGFTGIMIILFGFLVFFFNLRDKKEATEE